MFLSMFADNRASEMLDLEQNVNLTQSNDNRFMINNYMQCLYMAVSMPKSGQIKCFTYYNPLQTGFIHHLLNFLRSNLLTFFKAP